MDTKQLKDRVEKARAELLDALDKLDGVEDNNLDPGKVRDRISAEIGRETRQIQTNPWIAMLVSSILGAVISGMFFISAGKRFFC